MHLLTCSLCACAVVWCIGRVGVDVDTLLAARVCSFTLLPRIEARLMTPYDDDDDPAAIADAALLERAASGTSGTARIIVPSTRGQLLRTCKPLDYACGSGTARGECYVSSLSLDRFVNVMIYSTAAYAVRHSKSYLSSFLCS